MLLKKVVIAILLPLLHICSAQVVNAGPNEEQLSEKRLRYETEYMMSKLGLRENTESGNYFAKTYAEYRSEMENVFRNPELIVPEVRNGKKGVLSDEQIDENNKTRFKHAENMVKVRRKYYSKFRKYLSAKDMENFYNYERRLVSKARSEMKRRHAYTRKEHQRRRAR